jgi:hypothetical protein
LERDVSRALIVGAVLAVLFIVWNTGALDPQLYRLHLNKNDCARNLVTGAVFCGDELQELRTRQQRLRRELRNIGR